ncbi:hypothetical protein A7A08_01727 [Methyloligella halotolerans]|uniref:Uncharacterized protein n=1 Tax=Methyloligella halotolerans TaxID=1177755 RepID=A0A1E2RZV7_9HYPH|nr:hypothetical protein [Methyloligella halotolerans]ODA67692.1 hypothetical protein A7A08_01727 [Methyloligella halotolerans]
MIGNLIGNLFASLFSGIWTLLMLALIGGFAGGVIYFAGRLAGGIKGAAVGACVGTVLTVGVYYSGVVDQFSSARDKAEIARLEAANRKLTHDLAALNDVRDFEQRQAAKREAQLEEAKESAAHLQEVIDRHEGRDEEACPIAVFEDELEAIRNLK